MIRAHDLDGLDIDIEQTTDESVQLCLIRNLYEDFGPDFIQTMAPVASALTNGSNLSGFNYSLLDAQAVESNGNNLISWFNAQFYNGFVPLSLLETY